MGPPSTRHLLLNRRTHGRIPRVPLALALLASATSIHSQALPPTAPTTPPAASASPVPLPQPAPERSLRLAHVAYTAGRLQVSANDSSLNQILREIGRVTGMKITGGVAEERVFGSYGPADPSTVLSALLDGTGSNIMLRFDSARRPTELVLTPRQGGPTPPNPNASRYASREDDLPPDRRFGRPDQAGAQSTFPPAHPPIPGTIMPPSAASPTGAAAPSSDTTTQQSPNGVKTPQEIYDQLMKMQQQQQQQKPPQ